MRVLSFTAKWEDSGSCQKSKPFVSTIDHSLFIAPQDWLLHLQLPLCISSAQIRYKFEPRCKDAHKSFFEKGRVLLKRRPKKIANSRTSVLVSECKSDADCDRSQTKISYPIETPVCGVLVKSGRCTAIQHIRSIKDPVDGAYHICDPLYVSAVGHATQMQVDPTIWFHMEQPGVSSPSFALTY